MTRTLDFDAFRAEQKLEPLELVIGGRLYSLPPSMPAALALDVVRLNDTLGADAEPKIEDLLSIGAALFGTQEMFHQVLTEAGVGLNELGALIQMIVLAYSGGSNQGNVPTKA